MVLLSMPHDPLRADFSRSCDPLRLITATTPPPPPPPPLPPAAPATLPPRWSPPLIPPAPAPAPALRLISDGLRGFPLHALRSSIDGLRLTRSASRSVSRSTIRSIVRSSPIAPPDARRFSIEKLLRFRSMSYMPVAPAIDPADDVDPADGAVPANDPDPVIDPDPGGHGPLSTRELWRDRVAGEEDGVGVDTGVPPRSGEDNDPDRSKPATPVGPVVPDRSFPANTSGTVPE